MKDTLHEQLSALVDDELTREEQALLLRRVGRDAELQGRLSRYQLISDALQNHLPEHVDHAFATRIHTALRNEPAPQTGVTGRFRLATYARPAAGLAVAASVAVVAVLSLQSVRQETPSTPVVATAPADTNSYIRAGEDRQPEGKSRAGKQLDIYLVNHNEYAVNRGMQGILPYARIVDDQGAVTAGTNEGRE